MQSVEVDPVIQTITPPRALAPYRVMPGVKRYAERYGKDNRKNHGIKSPWGNKLKRATMVFFDEAAFCSDELIAICEAFATQNTDFITDIDDNYNPEVEPRRVPTQLVYASSQDQMDKLFYRHYKNFAKRMLAGDRDYFVCDMVCDTAIQTFMNGKPYTPLLTQDKVDAALKSNKEKALREWLCSACSVMSTYSLLNCWNPLKAHIPQRSHEIRASATVTKVERNMCMA